MTDDEARKERAREASRRSREKRKARQAGILPAEEPKPKKAKSLRDYADALKHADLSVYTHQALDARGNNFSIHKSAEAAQVAADRIGGTVAAFTPTQSTYWRTGEQHYDH